MDIAASPRVEAFRLREHRLVAIRRGEPDEHWLSRPELFPIEDSIARRIADGALHRRIVARYFLDGRWYQARVRYETIPRVGEASQREHRISNQVRCGLCAGHQKQDALREE